ncbi:phytosulfokine receptor 1-like [Dorcoceras hygrometricum]|uniref:Phytosulfokine receptor 1-like n=1 Tax=Dorcoceras hygrometricum TaxID=472368 RepID=A0A2Z7B6B9_9LAMI|nr:phytosulfokine receptor 1-like [Dorcoceras hygrometricum]
MRERHVLVTVTHEKSAARVSYASAGLCTCWLLKCICWLLMYRLIDDDEPRYDVVLHELATSEELEISRVLMYRLIDDDLVVASAEEQENNIRTAIEDDRQQLRNLFIVIHFRSGGSISCLNTQHDTWNSK